MKRSVTCSNDSERYGDRSGATGRAQGLAGVIAGYPLDTIKVRLQTQNATFPRYKGILHCLRCIVSKEGPAALYKGFN
uniref:ADP,ATP carrier protein n=1 Tax=Meloidogyne hapla TaxID=6305 RepID=A0A1I8BIN9_MELHA